MTAESEDGWVDVRVAMGGIKHGYYLAFRRDGQRGSTSPVEIVVSKF